MNIKEFKEKVTEDRDYRCTVAFGIFTYELCLEYDQDSRLKIFIYSEHPDVDLINLDKGFYKTESAIAYIRKQLEWAAKEILLGLK